MAHKNENHERITKSYFILVICISSQRNLLPHGNCGAILLPPEIGRISHRGNYPQFKNHYNVPTELTQLPFVNT
jgi:hypothetical protein